MTRLLDLPPELLTQIAREITPAELRRTVSNLLVCKSWYIWALPIYLSGLRLEAIYLSAHDIERFPSPTGQLYDMVCSNVKHISISLLGRPSKGKGHVAGGTPEDSPNYGRSKLDELVEWRRRFRHTLSAFLQRLPEFNQLERVRFSGSSDAHHQQGPRRDYLFKSSIEQLVSTVPVGLKYFNLDTWGSKLIPMVTETQSVHLCSLLSQRFDQFQHVKIRLRTICPSIFSAPSKANSNLRSMRINLILPSTLESELPNDYGPLSAQNCNALEESQAMIQESMCKAGKAFKRSRPELQSLKLLCRQILEVGINIWELCEVGQSA
ncbi:MAG: hypothetical protein Q9163_004787 [Psora crenata]